jgi:hypothetical protein
MKTTALLSVVALCASAMVAQGQSYIANLTPAQDGGGLRQGSGFATLVLSSTNTLKITGAWGGLSAPMTLGHIHGPSGPLPSSAAVIYDLIGPGILTGQGNTFGTYNGGSITIAPIGSYTVAQQISDLNNSLWYLNIHSTAFPGGEIRGVITPVPEPSTLALAGLGALGVIRRFRRRN